MHLSKRNIQAMKILFSSWNIVLLIAGIIVDEWVELTSEEKSTKMSHSPWMVCCTKVWPEDGLEIIRIMMILILNLPFILNLTFGLESTYIIPQNRYIHLITASLSFLSGILLFCVLLLYYLKLRQGQSLYLFSYRISWISFTGHINIFFLFVCGILSLLQYEQSHSCSCLDTHQSGIKCKESGSSIKVISLPECTARPSGIVHEHSEDSNEDVPNKAQIQTRRVTWAL
ncbi:PREDICTED: LOW QUALITY PROTEIN: transmembrane protein 225 [Propithecus coquereli]|nr:PREDICTED: LOW QUALITY PROTEIN: transmembrane protein 225 [Propithecus coquereli]